LHPFVSVFVYILASKNVRYFLRKKALAIGDWESVPVVVGNGTFGNWEGSGMLWEWYRSPVPLKEGKKTAESGQYLQWFLWGNSLFVVGFQ